LMENGQKVISFKIGVEAEKKKPAKNVAFSEAIPDIKAKIVKEDEEDDTRPEKFKLKPQLKLQEETEEEDENSENSDLDSDNESDDEPPRPKITIHPNLLPDGTIAATEAHRIGLKIELVKGELIAKNEKTGETYKVTAGQG